MPQTAAKKKHVHASGPQPFGEVHIHADGTYNGTEILNGGTVRFTAPDNVTVRITLNIEFDERFQRPEKVEKMKMMAVMDSGGGTIKIET